MMGNHEGPGHEGPRPCFGIDRRQFLKSALGTLALGMFSGCDVLRMGSGFNYKLPEWTGDSFPPMHLIRDGKAPAVEKPSKKAKIVIVGGGLSALTAAYQLRQEDVILLERESVVGGNAKQGRYRGVDYAKGSAYLIDVSGEYGELYSALGLSLTPLLDPVDCTFENGGFAGMDKSQMGKDFERMRGEMKKIIASPDFPRTPLNQATATAMKLDGVSFEQYLRDNHYSQPFIDYIDAYCFSALGGPVSAISAYGGINFYSEIAEPVYAFPGGNAKVALALADGFKQAGGGRIMNETSVYHVAQQPNGKVWVSYFNNYTHLPHTIECDTVIGATPYFFAPRIFKDLPKEHAAVMSSLHYGAYLVANLCFDQRVFDAGYDNWVPGNPDFTDFISADYASRPASRTVGKPVPYVMTVYAPFRDPRAGRSLLKAGNREQIADRVVKAVHQVVPFEPQALKEVRLTRYGHQLLTSEVGLMKKLQGLPKAVGPYLFSHSDGQGLSAIENAVHEGLQAARAAKARLSQGRVTMPVG